MNAVVPIFGEAAEREIARLRRRVRELEELWAEHKRQAAEAAAIARSDAMIGWLADKLGATPCEAAVALHLMARPNVAASHETLMHVARRYDRSDCLSATKVRVHRLRVRLKLAAPGVWITTVYGFGYRMDRRSVDLLRAALGSPP